VRFANEAIPLSKADGVLELPVRLPAFGSQVLRLAPG
jgi:hypothetical protein